MFLIPWAKLLAPQERSLSAVAASLRGLREAETRPVNVQRFADAQRDAWVEAHGWRGIDGIGWGKDRNRMGKLLKILWSIWNILSFWWVDNWIDVEHGWKMGHGQFAMWWTAFFAHEAVQCGWPSIIAFPGITTLRWPVHMWLRNGNPFHCRVFRALLSRKAIGLRCSIKSAIATYHSWYLFPHGLHGNHEITPLRIPLTEPCKRFAKGGNPVAGSLSNIDQSNSSIILTFNTHTIILCFAFGKKDEGDFVS